MAGALTHEAGLVELRSWLRGPYGEDFCDRAVWGALTVDEVDEVAADFGVTRREVGRELDAALTSGEA